MLANVLKVKRASNTRLYCTNYTHPILVFWFEQFGTVRIQIDMYTCGLRVKSPDKEEWPNFVRRGKRRILNYKENKVVKEYIKSLFDNLISTGNTRSHFVENDVNNYLPNHKILRNIQYNSKTWTLVTCAIQHNITSSIVPNTACERKITNDLGYPYFLNISVQLIQCAVWLTRGGILAARTVSREIVMWEIHWYLPFLDEAPTPQVSASPQLPIILVPLKGTMSRARRLEKIHKFFEFLIRIASQSSSVQTILGSFSCFFNSFGVFRCRKLLF